jgi:hypothetical protein
MQGLVSFYVKDVTQYAASTQNLNDLCLVVFSFNQLDRVPS